MVRPPRRRRPHDRGRSPTRSTREPGARGQGHGADPGVARIGAARARKRSTSARSPRRSAPGRSQDVDGVTLDDEGVAGERIDAELRSRSTSSSTSPRTALPIASSMRRRRRRARARSPARGDHHGAVQHLPRRRRRPQPTSASAPAETRVFFGAAPAARCVASATSIAIHRDGCSADQPKTFAVRRALATGAPAAGRRRADWIAQDRCRGITTERELLELRRNYGSALRPT